MSGQIADEVFRADLDDGEKLVAKIFESVDFNENKRIYDTLYRQNRKSFADPFTNESKTD